MKISDQALTEFVELYREEFEEEISRSEAGEMAFRLVTLYEVLARRLPNEDASTLMPPHVEQPRPIGFRT